MPGHVFAAPGMDLMPGACMWWPGRGFNTRRCLGHVFGAPARIWCPGQGFDAWGMYLVPWAITDNLPALPEHVSAITENELMISVEIY